MPRSRDRKDIGARHVVGDVAARLSAGGRAEEPVALALMRGSICRQLVPIEPAARRVIYIAVAEGYCKSIQIPAVVEARILDKLLIVRFLDRARARDQIQLAR